MNAIPSAIRRALAALLAVAGTGLLSAQEPSAAPTPPPVPARAAAPAVPEPPPAGERFMGRYQDLILFGRDAVLEKGEVADELVAIGGNVTANGEVRRGIVAVAGSVRATGPVGGDVVALLGGAHVSERVDGDVVVVLGNAQVDGRVDRDVVVILGDLRLGPEAVVNGDAVSIGGEIFRAPGSIARGDVQVMSFGGLPNFSRYQEWFRQCLLYGRPLAFDRRVGWAWGIAAAFLLFYVFLGLFARKGMEKCLVTLAERPGRTVLATILTLILTPLLTALLVVTGVGAIALPLLMIGMLGATLFGRAALLAALGRGLLRPFGGRGMHPALAVALGGIVVALMYTIPVIGFLLWKFLGAFGFGLVVYTVILSMKRERPIPAGPAVPPRPLPPTLRPEPPAVAAFRTASGDTPAAYGLVAPVPPAASDAATAEPPPAAFASVRVEPPSPIPEPPATALVRAGFWRRIFALALDGLLIALLVGPPSQGALILPTLALYAACMWKLRGTTIGGIILGLRVVRLDDRPVDWTTAIVRSLSCFLSAAALFLGFIWVAFDLEKQGWHDKIAGTIVVRAPRGMSLI